MRILLICVFVVMGLVSAKATTGEELVALARQEAEALAAWSKRCMGDVQYNGVSVNIPDAPIGGLTRECSNSRPKVTLFNKQFEISGTITCRISAVDSQGDVNCVTQSGIKVYVDSYCTDATPQKQHNWGDPYDPAPIILQGDRCITEKLYVNDVITVETTAASVGFQPTQEGEDPLILTLGGEFGRATKVTLMGSE